MNTKILPLCLVLLLSACSKPDSSDPATSQAQAQPTVTELKSERVGSLTEDSANSPHAFFDAMVNGRPQFSNDIVDIDSSTKQQTITNTGNTVTATLIWKQIKPNEWENTKITATLSNAADGDSVLAFLRLPYRLNDSNVVNNSMSQSRQESPVSTRLSNGAILTVQRDSAGTGLLIE